MRFIFVSFSQSVFPEIVEVSNQLHRLGHRTVYWLGSSEPSSFIDESGKTGVVDDDFLLSLSNHVLLEAKDLVMLNEQEPFIFDFLHRMQPRHTLPQLERRYHLLFRYCKWLLEQMKPNVIVFRTTPNLPPVHFILYSLARARGIRTIIFCDTWVSQRVIAMTDFILGPSNLKKNTEDQSIISPAKLAKDLQAYYNSQIRDVPQGVPAYMPHILQGYSFFNRGTAAFRAIRQAWRLRLLKKMWRTLASRVIFWFRHNLSNELPRAYKKLSSKADFTKPFIYFPLHLQPEFSTNPLGGHFRNQLLALELLVASLPSGWQIYVKEHPTQWLVGGARRTPYRPKDYYSIMARFPSVRLIPVDTDSFQLIRQAKAVATISGTAGWEAVLRGKPSLVFGYPWYQHAPGVSSVTDLASCQTALARIAAGEVPDPQAVLRFLKHLDEVSFRGCLDLSYRTNSKYFTETPESQARGMLKIILGLL